VSILTLLCKVHKLLAHATVCYACMRDPPVASDSIRMSVPEWHRRIVSMRTTQHAPMCRALTRIDAHAIVFVMCDDTIRALNRVHLFIFTDRVRM
jgi:hypothetical protein